MSVIPLVFDVQGDQNAVRAFNALRDGGRGLASSLDAADKEAGALTRRLQSAGSAGSALKSVSADARALGADLTKASKQGGNALVAQLGKGTSKAKSLLSKLGEAAGPEGIVGGALASYGLRSMSDNLIQAGDEAEAVGLKLEGMAKALGLPSSALKDVQALSDEMAAVTGMDDDEIANAAAKMLSFGMNAKQVRSVLPGLIGQARTMDQSLESVAVTFGKAFAQGSLAPLKRTGMVFSPEDLEELAGMKQAEKKARGMLLQIQGDIANGSKKFKPIELQAQLRLQNKILGENDFAARQKFMMKASEDSLKNFALKASEGRSKAQVARGRYATQVGNFQESMGQGAGALRAAYQGPLASLLANVNSNAPGVAKAAGMGVEAASIVAPVVTGAATLGQALPAFKLFGDTARGIGTTLGLVKQATDAANIAEGANTLATRTNTVATVMNGNASTAAAGKLRLASLNSASALGKVGIGLGAVAAVAWSIQDIARSLEDSTLSDENYVKKRGLRGQAELTGADFLNSRLMAGTAAGWLAGNTPMHQAHLMRGEAAERELERMNARRTSRVTTNRTGTATNGGREREIRVRLNDGPGSFRRAQRGQ